MFLTRIGFGSTAVITGDITQVDLPKGTRSGLHHVIEVLKDVPLYRFTHFQPKRRAPSFGPADRRSLLALRKP